MRLAARLLALAAGGVLAGCGISDPYNKPAPAAPPRPAHTTTVLRPGMGPIDPEPVKPDVTPARLPATPDDAIGRYAALAGNWDWRTVTQRYRAVLPLTVLAAHVDAQQIVAQIALDPRYHTTQMRQETALEAIVPKGSAGPDRLRFLVIQRRRILMKDTPPSRQWLVTLATLHRYDGRWAVERWEDQA
jgi:hypothetical protein